MAKGNMSIARPDFLVVLFLNAKAGGNGYENNVKLCAFQLVLSCQLSKIHMARYRPRRTPPGHAVGEAGPSTSIVSKYTIGFSMNFSDSSGLSM